MKRYFRVEFRQDLYVQVDVPEGENLDHLADRVVISADMAKRYFGFVDEELDVMDFVECFECTADEALYECRIYPDGPPTAELQV